MKVAALQMASTNDVHKNVEMACNMIKEASQKGALLAVLPEEFATLGYSAPQRKKLSEIFGEGPIQSKLQEAAKTNNIWVVVGSLVLKSKDENPYSSSLVINNKGEIVARYNKMHLFDVVVEGKEEYRESDNIKAGNDIVVVDSPVGKLGLSICYDVRFPELYRALMLKGAEVLLVPSAFTVQTGQAHWEILLRARAVENACYVIAPGECGHRHDNRPTYGHSLIINPWGKILASGNDSPGIIIADINKIEQQELRQQFPSIKHIRNDILQALAMHSSD